VGFRFADDALLSVSDDHTDGVTAEISAGYGAIGKKIRRTADRSD
jgi:hypothetical protein